FFFFFSSRRRHTRFSRDWSSDVCSSDLPEVLLETYMRPRIVAGNWKMNGDRDFAAALVGELAAASLPGGVQAIVMPPFPYLAGLARDWAGKGIAFGGQDVSEHEKGAYTGDRKSTRLN